VAEGIGDRLPAFDRRSRDQLVTGDRDKQGPGGNDRRVALSQSHQGVVVGRVSEPDG
jgi:hypothetical protein